jgi:uncharacterized damage-inducible protein DinB
MDPGVQFSELLAYNEKESARWRQFFEEHPAALELPCDVAGAGTVKNLVLHVFQTELFFANLLTDQPNTGLETMPTATLKDLFAMHAEARAKFEEALAKTTEEQWHQNLSLRTLDFAASRRKMFVQAMLHGVHHRAQLATHLRQHGFKQNWIHDFVLSSAMS